jgi:hypothetical protein
MLKRTLIMSDEIKVCNVCGHIWIHPADVNDPHTEVITKIGSYGSELFCLRAFGESV